MERWQGLRLYDERSFERKLRREKRGPLWEESTQSLRRPHDLIRDQTMDLIDGLDLTEAMKKTLKLKVDGWTLREIAVLHGTSRQNVEGVWGRLQTRLAPSSESLESRMIAGRVPHYGWQEVFMDSQRLL